MKTSIVSIVKVGGTFAMSKGHENKFKVVVNVQIEDSDATGATVHQAEIRGQFTETQVKEQFQLTAEQFATLLQK